MTWVSLPIDHDDDWALTPAQRAVMRLADGDVCRVRLADGEEREATCDAYRGFCWRDDDGEPLDVVAVEV